MYYSEELIQEIRENSIVELSLRCIGISLSEMKQIAEAFRSNQSITTLILSDDPLEADKLKIITEALIDNKSVTTLDLTGAKIGIEGAKKIAEVLKHNQTISTLFLDDNKVGDSGIKHLVEALMTNQSVSTIFLNSNQISDSGAEDIAVILKDNTHIKKLYLSTNFIGNSGIKQIAESLKFNKSLTTIDLAFNEIGNYGAKSIAEAIENNQGIEELHLEFNQIGDSGMKDIKMALKKNCYIKTLTFYEAFISDNLEYDIGNCLVNNIMLAEKDDASLNGTNDLSKIDQTPEFKDLCETNVQCVPEVKLFQIQNIMEPFDKDNFVTNTIVEISDLIRDGRDKLQEHGKKGILLLGNTGAGKSTLANLFSGKMLQAIIDAETKELVIDTVLPNENIVIGHKLTSETKIPNKCSVKDINIWDCPGFNDTDPVQEIVNMFYIKRLFEISDQLKFVLIIPEVVLHTASARGTMFLETLSCFIKCFNDIQCIKNCISLVFTHVPHYKTIQDIEKAIDNILATNQNATPEHKMLINELKDNMSIYLFNKPSTEGKLNAKISLTPSNFPAKVFASSQYCSVQGDMVNKVISKRAMNCSLHFLNTASNNFNQLLEVIITAISTPIQCLNNLLNPFLKKYDLIKNWIPASVQYKELPWHKKQEFFLEYDLLLNMQKVLNCSTINISDSVQTFQKAVEIFAEYAESGNQHKVQDFGYCLQQQYEYVEFFANICGIELPDHTKIVELISICHRSVTKSFEHYVKSLSINENQTDKEYYLKAIQYLEYFPNYQKCKEQKAIAYSCLASIAEKTADKELPLVYYEKAIAANSHLPEVYEKIGQLYFKEGQYAKAIHNYKVVNKSFKIKECFEAWLKKDPENPYIMLKQAEYFESIGIFARAIEYYHYAFSLSHDINFKALTLKRIHYIMNNEMSPHNFITKAQTCNFYDFPPTHTT